MSNWKSRVLRDPAKTTVVAGVLQNRKRLLRNEKRRILKIDFRPQQPKNQTKGSKQRFSGSIRNRRCAWPHRKQKREYNSKKPRFTSLQLPSIECEYSNYDWGVVVNKTNGALDFNNFFFYKQRKHCTNSIHSACPYSLSDSRTKCAAIKTAYPALDRRLSSIACKPHRGFKRFDSGPPNDGSADSRVSLVRVKNRNNRWRIFCIQLNVIFARDG